MALLIDEKTFSRMAANRARGQFDRGIESQRRQAERMGVDPSSGRYQSIAQDAQFDKAAGMAAASNEASSKWLEMAQQQLNWEMMQAQKNRDNFLNQSAHVGGGSPKHDKGKYADYADAGLNKHFGKGRNMGQTWTDHKAKSPYADENFQRKYGKMKRVDDALENFYGDLDKKAKSMTPWRYSIFAGEPYGWKNNGIG